MEENIERYTIHQTADMTGISEHTIRYYDKCGYFAELYRTGHGNRRFTDEDIDRLRLVDALRKSGLSIEGIKYFLGLLDDPDKKEEVAKILDTQCNGLKIRIDEDEASLAYLRCELSILTSKHTV